MVWFGHMIRWCHVRMLLEDEDLQSRVVIHHMMGPNFASSCYGGLVLGTVRPSLMVGVVVRFGEAVFTSFGFVCSGYGRVRGKTTGWASLPVV